MAYVPIIRPAPTIRPLVVISLTFAAWAFGQTGVANPGFEAGEKGSVPPGWFVPAAVANAGFTATVVTEGCRTGAQCALITGVSNPPPNMFGNLMQNVPAAGYTLHRVRLRSAIRVEGPNTHAQMWLRLDRADNSMVFLDNMQARPITSSSWNTYDIVVNVPADVARMALGVMLFGPGKAWVDDCSIDNLAEIHKDSNEPPHPLTSRELTNLTAFTKLYGYVRFFHPSDQAAATDWETFAIDGVRKVAPAASNDELIARLQELFRPIAPLVQINVSRPAPMPTGPEMVRYEHHGVKLAGPIPNNVYTSDRKRSPAAGQTIPQPFEADLVPGIHVSVPVAVYANAEGTLPHAPLPVSGALYDRSAEDRATRIGDIVIAWNVFQHFYPYFDVVKTDWSAELPKDLRAASEDKSAADFQLTLRRLVAALKDGHGNVMGPRVRYLQPPITMDWIEGHFVVTRVQKGKADAVAPGDLVLKIDGTAIEQAADKIRPLISGATKHWIDYRLASELSTCDPDTKQITLELEPYSSPTNITTVTLPCGNPQNKNPETYTEPRPDKITELEAGIIYVDLDRVTEQDWTALVPRLEKAKGIIFDMRGYPGQPGIQALAHLTDSTIRSAKWNIASAALPDRLDSPFNESGWDVQPQTPYFTARRVFLTDGRAISYAETVMGIVEHYKLGEIVGGPTAGTNGNVNPFTLPGGFTITWTGMKVLKHDGSQHHGIGIVPTVPASRTRKGVAEGKDEILLRGLEVVKAQ